MQPLVHPNEVIDLLIFLLAIPVFVRTAKITPKKSNFSFGVAYIAMLVALTATIIEGLVWPVALNTLEHLCYTVAGISFAVGALKLPKPDAGRRVTR